MMVLSLTITLRRSDSASANAHHQCDNTGAKFDFSLWFRAQKTTWMGQNKFIDFWTDSGRIASIFPVKLVAIINHKSVGWCFERCFIESCVNPAVIGASTTGCLEASKSKCIA